MTDQANNLQLLAGLGGHLEYYGSSDPRWSQPLRLINEGAAIVAETQGVQPDEKNRPATWDEVTTKYRPKDYERILKGADEQGNPTYFVVNALYRSPWDQEREGHLTELPSLLRITHEDMEVFGPWIGLTRDEHVSDVGENILDDDATDGVDHIFATRYDWKDLESVSELLNHLLHLQKVKSGEANNRQGWSVAVDDVRLAVLTAQVMVRYDELKKAQPHTPGKKEQLVEGTINGAGFGLGTAAAAAAVITPVAFVAIKVYKHGFGYFGDLWSGAAEKGSALVKWIRGAFPKALEALKTLLTSPGKEGIVRILMRTLGPVAAVLIGNFVWGKVLRGSAECFAGGAEDDPEDRLFWYVWDEMSKEAWGGGVVGTMMNGSMGTLHRSSVGIASYVSDDFENGIREAHNIKKRQLVKKSDNFGNSVTNHLLAFVSESEDGSTGQIDWRKVQSKVAAFYHRHEGYFEENYDLLVYTAHRSHSGRLVQQMIGTEGRIVDRDVMRDYLRKIVERRLEREKEEMVSRYRRRDLVRKDGSLVSLDDDVEQDGVLLTPEEYLTEVQIHFLENFGDVLQRRVVRLERLLKLLNGGGIEVKPEEVAANDEPSDAEILEALAAAAQ